MSTERGIYMSMAAIRTGMSIRRLCYELYKIDWMRRISADVQMDSLKQYYEDQKMDEETTTYEEVLNEFGFGGQYFVCFDEFLNCEYQDKEKMMALLGNKELYREYLEDIEEE